MKHDNDVIMPHTDFASNGVYGVEVTKKGVTVYSECCSDTMSRETAARLRDAIDAWLAMK